MGDGDGSDGGVGAGDGGAGTGAGDGGGGFDFIPYDASPSFFDPYSDVGGYTSQAEQDEFARKYPGWTLQGAYGQGGMRYAPIDQNLADSLGYKGSLSPEAIGSGENFAGVANPQWQQFLHDNGLRLGVNYTGPGGQAQTQAFKGDQRVGNAYNWNESAFDSPEFGTIVGLLASAGGGLAGAYMGGLGGLSGAGLGAATGAGSGFAGTLSQTADIGQGLKGAAIGGITGGGIGAVNPAGQLGLDSTSPFYKPINSAVGAGVNAALRGGDIGSSVLSSLGTSGLSMAGTAGLNALNGATMGDEFKDYGDPLGNGGLGLGQGSYDAPSGTGGYGQNPYMSNPTRGFDYGSANDFNLGGGGLGLNGGGEYPTMQNTQLPPGTGGYGSNPYQFPSTQALQQPQEQGSNPFKSFIQSATGFMGQPGRMDNMAANLMDLYNRYRINKQQRGLAKGLEGLYAPGSPYAQILERNLMRADAASGRRTQVAPRQVELQARLADAASRQAPTLNSIYGQMGANRNMGLFDIYRMMAGGPNGGGGLNMLRDLGRYFQPQGNLMGANPASDYNYQNGSDIGG